MPELVREEASGEVFLGTELARLSCLFFLWRELIFRSLGALWPRSSLPKFLAPPLPRPLSEELCQPPGRPPRRLEELELKSPERLPPFWSLLAPRLLL